MRKILYIILPIVLAVAVAAGAAFSAWKFETVDKSQSILAGKVDDIFENYDIKKSNDNSQVNRVSTYEMYLYPSTLYLNDYLDCLDSDGNVISGAVLPEEKYGYIEPVTDRGGAVNYNVVDNGNKGGDSAYLSDVSKNDNAAMSDSSITADMYCNVYEKNSDWNKTDDNIKLTGTVQVGSASVAANSKYLCGDPTLDKTVLSYNYEDEQHGWRNLHYYDRFGYWPTLANGGGRYLPLKITIDEDFSNTYYNNVVLTPFADMGDPHNWYVYTFSCWAYVAFTDNSYTVPYYATDDFASANSVTNYVDKNNGTVTANPSLGAFCPTMVSQYFDIIQSFEKYVDRDGIIRLFPKFSNGKGYQDGSGKGTIKDGGGDAVKTVPELKDKDGNKRALGPTDQHELYMFYSTESGTVTSGSSTATVHVSVLPNIDIDTYYSLNFKVAFTESLAGWPGGWTDIYSLGREASSGGNKNIPETLKSYGYGLYNLYLFMTQVATSTSTTDYTSALEDMRKSLVNKEDAYKASFPSFFGKNLLPIASVCTGGKSFMLVAEKVREAKFIDNVNFGESNYTTEEQVETKYLSTHKSFRLINKELFGRTEQNGWDDINPINDEFPYCYILQNVDFTEATTRFCQVRFQRAYRSDLHFADPNPTTGESEYRYRQIKFDGQIYEQGFGNYFNLVNAAVYSKDGAVSTQQVIQLRDEEMRGVYDIILIFRSARESNPDSPYAYNIGLFAYRHTNIFLKVFENNPTGTVEYYQGTDGAVLGNSGTTYKFVDHSDTPLFNKSYPIGVSVKSSDKNDGGSINDVGTTLAECVNGVVGSRDPTGVKLYDHVTGAEVAHYVKKSDLPATDDTAALTYNGENYVLVFNPFKIRKNYIFYISYE